jgi:RHS repeat-associated protein
MESTQPVLRCRYSYDPLDRLISQLQPDAPAHQRFYCKSRLATEIEGGIGYSIIQHDDLLLAQQQRQDGMLDTTLLATDLQRSVLNTLKVNQQRQPIAYSPYGHRSAESGLSSLLGFNGERPDPVTGHYLLGNGYRAFNSVLMRFNSPDSLSPFEKGGLNAYAYCAGDPINGTDPTGHAFIKNLIRAVSSPLDNDTIQMLYATKKSLGGARTLRAEAVKQGTTAEKLLLEKSINRSISEINQNLSHFENPQFKITNADQIQSIFDSTRQNIKKHTKSLYKLRFHPATEIDQKLKSDISNTFMKTDRFHHREAMRVSLSRFNRLKQNGVIDYTPGGPPNYDDELFPREPNASNNYIRRV